MKIYLNPSAPRTFRIRFNDDETRIEATNFIAAITTYLQTLTPNIEIELQILHQLPTVLICWMYDVENKRQMFLVQDITGVEDSGAEITEDVFKLQAIAADVAALAAKYPTIVSESTANAIMNIRGKRGRPRNTADQNLARDFKRLAKNKRKRKRK